jgi:hypothetical protein
MFQPKKHKNFLINLDVEMENAYKVAIELRDPQNYSKIKCDLDKLFLENKSDFPEYQSVHVSFQFVNSIKKS